MTASRETHVEHRVRVEAGEALALRALFDVIAVVDGRPSIDPAAWIDLTQDGREGLSALVAHQDGRDRPVGYAQVARDRRGWSLELAVDPEVRTPDSTVGEDLARAATALIAEAGGGDVQLWLDQVRPAEKRMAAAAGLAATRALYQVRRPLPVEVAVTTGAKPIETRPFRSGVDETAWLEVNNRAFAWHPEQGGWDLAMLARHEAEPWFDPDGFLLLDVDGRLGGFCWTKVHEDEDPVQGEIYVIAVDPDFEGQGLGRALTLAGLDHLAALGVTVGMLYVDAANVGAVKLYTDLGFVVDHVHRAFTGTVEGGSVRTRQL